MTKEIREGIHWDTALARIIIESNLVPSNTPYWKVVELAKNILKYQDSQDVVIRVKCPDCVFSQFRDEVVGMTPCYCCNSTGYIFETLIEKGNSLSNSGDCPNSIGRYALWIGLHL